MSADGNILTIDNFTNHHEGVYTCSATNDAGTDWQQSLISVSECRSSLTMLQVPECLVTVILADESQTWTGSYLHIPTICLELERQLQAAGVGVGRANRYAVVGFGTDDMQAHIVSVNSSKLLPANMVADALRILRNDGVRPDGFHAIKHALEHLPLRQGSSKQCALHILIATQENNMKALGHGVTKEQVNGLLCNNEPVIMTAILGGSFVVGSKKVAAFGVDSTLSAFVRSVKSVAKVQGDIKLQQVAYSVCNSFRDYGEWALRHYGSVWDLYHFASASLVERMASIQTMANVTVTSLVSNFRTCKDCSCRRDLQGEIAQQCRLVKRPFYCSCRRQGTEVG